MGEFEISDAVDGASETPAQQHVIFSRICALSIALSTNDVTNFWSLV